MTEPFYQGVSMSLRALQEAAHKTAVEKGWWEEIEDSSIIVDEYRDRRSRSLMEQFMLMVTEIGEAAEEIRKPDARPFYVDERGKPEGWAVELADVVIRIMDTCGKYEVDLQGLVELKMKYNEGREYKHGGKVL